MINSLRELFNSRISIFKAKQSAPILRPNINQLKSELIKELGTILNGIKADLYIWNELDTDLDKLKRLSPQELEKIRAEFNISCLELRRQISAFINSSSVLNAHSKMPNTAKRMNIWVSQIIEVIVATNKAILKPQITEALKEEFFQKIQKCHSELSSIYKELGGNQNHLMK